ncbi:MAG TPA: BCD family MFS transporter, partial [Aggregatilineales bacterium]|nr:BCD family MFS transporter [Aggregatilineales bacterium]
SDHTDWRGYRRLPWVWGGRLSMIFGYLLLAFSTVELTRQGSLWWIGIFTGFLIASLGYSISGSTFLALVYDRAPQHQRGRAVGVVWTFLLAGYAIAGVLFARLLPEYSESAFITFFVVVSILLILIWTFALWGEEKRHTIDSDTQKNNHQINTGAHFRDELRELWKNQSTQALAFFMLLSFCAAFMHETLLEPFGGGVFGLSVGETSRFQAYWGTMAIVSSALTLWAYRRFQQYGYQHFARYGVIIMMLTFSLLTVTALSAAESLLRPALVLLGVGYGLWNIGTLGLMVENSREEKAGFDLGVWTVIVTLSRGGGILMGAVLFDVFEFTLGDTAGAYGMVFALEALILIAALVVVNQLEATAAVKSVKNDADGELILASSMD